MKKEIICPWARAAQRIPESTAFISGGEIISFGAFGRMAESATSALRTQGIKRGDKVAALSANSLEYVLLLVALWRIGAIACPVSTRLPPANLRASLRKIGAKKILTGIRFNSSGVVKFQSHSISLDQSATIVFTSGSSGAPKAALHSFGNHCYNALGSNQNIKLTSGDRWLLSLPLYHVGGLGILFRCALASAAVVIPDKSENLSLALAKYHPTHLSLVSTQLFRLLQSKKDIQNLRRAKAILVGGSAISENLIGRAHQLGLPISTTYGLTEMASQVTTTRKNASLSQLKTSGKILAHRQIKIAKNGEILLKGQTLFKGYVDKGRVRLPLLKDGWFPTGDVGQISKDGCLRVLGRKDKMFISGGENIQPEEIRKALATFRGIKEAVVISVKNPEFGFRPVALLKIKPGNKITRAALSKHLQTRIPKFKIPDRFYSSEKNSIKEIF